MGAVSYQFLEVCWGWGIRENLNSSRRGGLAGPQSFIRSKALSLPAARTAFRKHRAQALEKGEAGAAGPHRASEAVHS